MFRKVRRWLWRGWVFVMTFIISPLAVCVSWTDPLWGPPWGYIVAVILTCFAPIYIYEYVTGKYRG